MAGLMMSRLEKTWGPMCNQNQLLKYLMMSPSNSRFFTNRLDGWTWNTSFSSVFLVTKVLDFSQSAHWAFVSWRREPIFSQVHGLSEFFVLFLQGSIPGCVSFTVEKKVASSNQTWPKYAKIMENPKFDSDQEIDFSVMKIVALLPG